MVEIEPAAGEPKRALPDLVKHKVPALVFMGAFGRSLLRQ